MLQVVFGEEVARKLKDVPLSNDVIASRINKMSDDVPSQIITGINSSPIRVSLQLG